VSDQTSVLHASSVLALAHNETGASAVAAYLDGSAISTVNWSEIVRRTQERAVRIDDLRATLSEAGVALMPFDVWDAETAGDLWVRTRHRGLSLADRACLALAAKLGVPAVTADRAWVDLDVGVEVVCIR
jgi:ribonuclease VapC